MIAKENQREGIRPVDVNKQLHKWQNKRKAISIILDFVKHPTEYPSIRYHHIKAYLMKLKTQQDIIDKHFCLLERVLEVEYMGIKARIKEIGGVK